MQIPDSFIQSLAAAPGFDKEKFLQVHQSGEQVTSVRVNPAKPIDPHVHFQTPVSPIPWSTFGYYLGARPSFTFDPLFHAGTYYVQEASSMFLEQALRQTVDLSQPLRVLDLCASPGGKSTHLQSLLSPESLLVSNDIIRSRANVLKDNIVKWGASNVVVSNNDPADFAKLSGYFDVLVVDAPCSGSGLIRREPEAMEEWSPNNVALCSQRQQRILADAWPALKEGGLLVYSTCSYSTEEDEKIVEWLLSSFGLKEITLEIDQSWSIVESKKTVGVNGYRFWPNRLKGEGLFLACFRKNSSDDKAKIRLRKTPVRASKTEELILKKWMPREDVSYVKHLETAFAWPTIFENEMSWLLQELKVIYAGTKLGELLRDKLIPDHALAMSDAGTSGMETIQLDKDDAIRFLQRKDLAVHPMTKGWQLVSYEHHPLGWVNVLQNRINNYYPKELRILKEK